MNQRPATLLLYPTALAGLAAVLFYAVRWRRESTTLLRDIRGNVEKNAARSAATYRLLKKQRRALCALSDYILPIPKGVEKTAS